MMKLHSHEEASWLKLGRAQLFEDMKMLKKFQAIWMNQTSSCFTMLYSDQKLGKIAQGKLFDELIQNLVERVDMDSRMPWKSFSLNEAR